jgi:hypothetical protein
VTDRPQRPELVVVFGFEFVALAEERGSNVPVDLDRADDGLEHAIKQLAELGEVALRSICFPVPAIALR